MKRTFYDWCVDTDNTYLLDLWDYSLNEKQPNEIGASSAKKMYFKCPRGIHESELYTINNITGYKNQKVNCRECHSFGQWCLDNNQQSLLDRWDYELNNVGPFDVDFMSGKKYYFKCPFNNPLHPSEAKILSNVVKQEGSRRCLGCESFGQWCIDNIDKDFMEKYWSEKNTINPFTITPTHTLNKVWIKCQNKDYHEDFDVYPYNYTREEGRGDGCPYCAKKRIHYYDSLGYRFLDKEDYWSEKNEISPFEVAPFSNKVFQFKCDIHGEYQARGYDFTHNNGVCPQCMRTDNISSLQRKVQDYIAFLGYDVLHENDCNLKPINPITNFRLYYDNEIPDLKLIIEVNGIHHYEINQFTMASAKARNVTPEEELEYQKYKDEFKKQYAISNGYEFLEIPYTAINRSEKYKTMISDKINEILQKVGSLTTEGDNEKSLS